jgi:hypothetical protein
MRILDYFDLNRRVASRNKDLFRRSVMPTLGPSGTEFRPDWPEPVVVLPPAAPSPARPGEFTQLFHKPARPPIAPKPAAPLGSATGAFTQTILPQAPANQIPIMEQILMYIGTVLGVVFSSAAMQFSAGKLDRIAIRAPAVIVAMVVAFVIIPVTFEKLNVKADAPLLVRFGLFVQHGVFWQVLFGTVGKAISG